MAKRIFGSISAMTFLFTVVFLLGALTNGSFNVPQWKETSVAICIGFGGFTSIIIGIVCFIFWNEIEK